MGTLNLIDTNESETDTKELIRLFLNCKKYLKENKQRYSIQTQQVSTNEIDGIMVSRGNSNTSAKQENINKDYIVLEENKDIILNDFLFYTVLADNITTSKDLLIIEMLKEATKDETNFYKNLFLKPTAKEVNLNHNQDILEFIYESGEIETVPFDDLIDKLETYLNENTEDCITTYISNEIKVQDSLNMIIKTTQTNKLYIDAAVVDSEYDINQINTSITKMKNFFDKINKSLNKELEKNDIPVVLEEEKPIKKTNFSDIIKILIIVLIALIFTGFLFIYIYTPDVINEAVKTERE